MGLLVPTLAAVIASFAASAAARGADRAVPSNTPAIRSDGGASATATVSARIIRISARGGAKFAPPHPHMVPRRTTVSAADGQLIPALVYDFE